MTTKQTPSILKIKKILAEMGTVLNERNIPYLVYGSLAYSLYTDDDDVRVNDLDIIISKEDFNALEQGIGKSKLPYKLFVTRHSIHANHKRVIGNDRKPFDISFDSFEHYFKDYEVDFKKFTNLTIENVPIRLISRDTLIRLYEVGVDGANEKKKEQYLSKIHKLKELQHEN